MDSASVHNPPVNPGPVNRSVTRRIDDYIVQADFLPPSFQLLPRLLLLLDDVEAGADTLAQVIRVDPGLTADILRVCNSAAHAKRVRAETIQEAIMRLGFIEVHRIVMTVIASSALKSPQETFTRHEGDLWKHSLAAAVASQVLVPGTGVDADVAYTASLLHDIGKMVLANAVPEDFARILTLAKEQNQAVYRVEQLQFQTDHGGIGARLLKRWGFPDNICEAVQHHHEPVRANQQLRLASCLYLSNVLAYRIVDDLTFPEYVVFPDTKALRELGFSQPTFEALAPEARSEFKKYMEQFR